MTLLVTDFITEFITDSRSEGPNLLREELVVYAPH